MLKQATTGITIICIFHNDAKLFLVYKRIIVILYDIWMVESFQDLNLVQRR